MMRTDRPASYRGSPSSLLQIEDGTENECLDLVPASLRCERGKPTRFASAPFERLFARRRGLEMRALCRGALAARGLGRRRLLLDYPSRLRVAVEAMTLHQPVQRSAVDVGNARGLRHVAACAIDEPREVLHLELRNHAL